MKSFESLFGERERSSVGIISGQSDKEGLLHSIKEKYNEKVEDVLLLFEHSHYVKGWLVKTRTRLVFALTQDVNNFRNFLEIEWLIDDIEGAKFNVKSIGENEISITDDKTILYDVGLYSSDRIVKDILQILKINNKPKEISNEVRKQIKIHPKIWRHISKMWQQYYGDNIKDVLHSLPLKANVDNFEKNNPLKFLSSLSLEDSLMIFKDIIENEEVKRDRNNDWNNWGDFIKEWRPQLLSYLKENGIEYDEDNKTFSLIGGEPIQILTSVRKLPKYLDIEFNEFFYNNLRDEINSTYKFGLFTSTMFLSRKLLENLVIDILRQKFPASARGNLELYFNSVQGRFNDFTILLKNLEDKKDEFGPDKEVITEFISLIKPFRPKANSNAHSIIIIGNEDDLLKFNVPKMSALLLRLQKNIQSLSVPPSVR